MSAVRVYSISLVPYEDLKTEGLTLMIVESGHTNCGMSKPEVRDLRRSVPPFHLLGYNRYILSATQLVVFFQLYSRKHRFITSNDDVPSTSNVTMITTEIRCSHLNFFLDFFSKIIVFNISICKFRISALVQIIHGVKLRIWVFASELNTEKITG